MGTVKFFFFLNVFREPGSRVLGNQEFLGMGIYEGIRGWEWVMFLGLRRTGKFAPRVPERWMVANGEVPAVKLMMWPVPPVVVVVGPKLTMSPM